MIMGKKQSNLNNIFRKSINIKMVNIASYAEMALRTANHRSYLMGEGSRRKELGICTVTVIPHVTACEICRLWLGVVLIDDVYSDGKQEGGEYTLLSKAIEDGLFHPNCEDILATWFPDINTVPTIPDPEMSEEWYKQAQKQRRLERAIRDQKRIIAGTLDEENMLRKKDAPRTAKATQGALEGQFPAQKEA